jgi:DNA sulfur modification protein DndD
MELRKITVENFRQFKEKHEIEFAHGDKNITIIYGENGKGKTGLFRAMMFGLFGDRNISQDSTNGSNALVNLISLNDNQGGPTQAHVIVEFSHLKIDYKVKRTVVAIKRSGKIVENESKAELVFFDREKSVEKSITDSNAVNLKIGEVFDKNIREFFFFDAEKIDLLNDNSRSEVKTIVRDGIVKVLQIDLIENSVKVLDKIIKRINKELSESSKNVNLKNKEAALAQREIEKSNENLRIETYDAESKAIANELAINEEKLSSNENIKELILKIEEKKNEKTAYLTSYNNFIQGVIEGDFKKYHQLLLSNELASINQEVSLSLRDEKSYIPKQLLRLTLENNECFFCKNKLEHNHEAIEDIKKLLHQSESTESITIKFMITSIINEFDLSENLIKGSIFEKLSSVEQNLKDIYKIDDQIEDLEHQISEISKNVPDIDETEKAIGQLKHDQEQVMNKIARANATIELLDKEIETLNKEIDNLHKLEAGMGIVIKRRDIIEDLHLKLQTLANNYCDEMRIKLSKEATRIFKGIIDEVDRNIIEKININEKYEVEIIGWKQEVITHNISKGQGQMVSLALISALSTLAAGNTHKIDFPLFMDTPFGRISGKNRDNLIMNMANYTSQWILLLTDTELTSSEEAVFKATGKLGKAYKLNQVAEYQSQIVSAPINQTIGERGYR